MLRAVQHHISFRSSKLAGPGYRLIVGSKVTRTRRRSKIVASRHGPWGAEIYRSVHSGSESDSEKVWKTPPPWSLVPKKLHIINLGAYTPSTLERLRDVPLVTSFTSTDEQDTKLAKSLLDHLGHSGSSRYMRVHGWPELSPRVGKERLEAFLNAVVGQMWNLPVEALWDGKVEDTQLQEELPSEEAVLILVSEGVYQRLLTLMSDGAVLEAGPDMFIATAEAKGTQCPDGLWGMALA